MKTVFLIDDDIDDREIFQAALESIDPTIQYTEARDGQEALNKMAGDGFKKPGLIFVDLNMPKVNGKEFLNAAKKMPEYKDVPVIIYSTSSIKEEKEKCIADGAWGFMTKHSSYDALCEDLKKILVEVL